MNRELEGKVAIVTGAATGIGKAIALAFGAADARVVVNYLDTPDLADVVVAQISRDGGEAFAVAADISKREEFEMLVHAAIDRFGSWDVLVNNAAVALVKPFEEVTEGEFEQSFQVNVKGT
jgi:3-oxoacyl-[acyl-carrier protein] reductase